MSFMRRAPSTRKLAKSSGFISDTATPVRRDDMKERHDGERRTTGSRVHRRSDCVPADTLRHRVSVDDIS